MKMEFRKDYIVWHVARNVVMMIHYLIEGMEDKLVICVVYAKWLYLKAALEYSTQKIFLCGIF